MHQFIAILFMSLLNVYFFVVEPATIYHKDAASNYHACLYRRWYGCGSEPTYNEVLGTPGLYFPCN